VAVPYDYFPLNGGDPVSWRAWATKITRDHHKRLRDGGSHATYTTLEVDTIRNGLRRFSEAFTRDQRERAVGATFGSSNHVVVLDESLEPVQHIVLGEVSVEAIASPSPTAPVVAIAQPKQVAAGAVAPAIDKHGINETQAHLFLSCLLLRRRVKAGCYQGW
jgi:hypothetical protein